MSSTLPLEYEKLDIAPELAGRLSYFAEVPAMRGPHRHDELELNLVVQGQAAYLLEDRRYELEPGSLVWLLPGQPHLMLEKSEPFSYWLGVFRREMATLPRPSGHLCARLPSSEARELRRLFAVVARSQGGPGHALGLRFALARSWEMFEANAEVGEAARLHPAVARVAADVRRRVEPRNLADLAREFGLSGPYLCALFKREMGMGLSEFRNLVRLERFRQLEGSCSTRLGAALEAGFGSYAQFYKVYRRAYGRGPGPARGR